MKTLTVISTFAGCGGSSLGYYWAGFKELLAIEWNKYAIEVFKLNFDCPIWQRDICNISAEEILEYCQIKKGELDVLDGSPPCQGFSTSGKREITDSRNDLSAEFARLLKGLQPKVFVIENVSGMIKGIMKGKFIEIMNMLKDSGYKVKCKLMNTKYYNIPQSRQRLIFIGVRSNLNIEPSFPEPNYKIINLRQALNNVPEDEKIYLKENTHLYSYYYRVKQGNSFGSIHPVGSYFTQRRLSWNHICCTIPKTCQIYHPDEPRYLTVSEVKRIFTYPDNFKFNNKLTSNIISTIGLMGNSVPPKFMQAIAENIKMNILSQIKINGAPAEWSKNE